ncbi:MAG: holo-ACP synthase [Treponema sp.]|nr:holo-ACP synthase [Treponema sp.]
MIIGVGIDIVEVKRMERWLLNESLLERYFHSDEISLALSRKNSAALTLAARFAAKEAFGKALGTGLLDISLKDIVVLNNNNGKPYIMLSDTAQKAFETSGANRMHISMSHEKENAIAIIIIERA